MTEVIEFRRRRKLASATLLTGLFCSGVFTFLVPDAPIGARLAFVIPSLALVALTLRPTFARSPRFRATDAGVWFGGGAVIPWSAIKRVYSAPSFSLGDDDTLAIGFELRKATTLFKTSVAHWLPGYFAGCQIHVAPSGEHGDVVAKLEAMRTQQGVAA